MASKESNRAYYLAHREARIRYNTERNRRDRKRHYAAVRAWKRKNRHKDAALRARRRAQCAQATPQWADLKAIREIYKRAAEQGLEVDHIVPVRGKTVCGLHVESNLQFLTRQENIRKGNRF